MTILLALYVASGALIAALALPLLYRKVPPNGLYGVRLGPTLRDPEVWYATNAYSARWLLASGLATVAAAVGFWLVPGITLDAYALSCLGVFVLSFVPGLIQTIRFMNALTRERSGGPSRG